MLPPVQEKIVPADAEMAIRWIWWLPVAVITLPVFVVVIVLNAAEWPISWVFEPITMRSSPISISVSMKYTVSSARVMTFDTGSGKSVAVDTSTQEAGAPGGFFHDPLPEPSATYTVPEAADATPFGSCRYGSVIFTCFTVMPSYLN